MQSDIKRGNIVVTLPRLRLHRLLSAQGEPQDQALTATELQQRYLPDVYRYVSRRVGRREDAEDVTADCFAAAFAALPSFRGQCEPRLWLLGIARRKVADLLRRKARRPEVFASDLGEDPPAVAASPEAAVTAREAQQQLRRMVFNLSEPQREALLLHYVEGLTQAEVAVVMGRSSAAVNSLLQRARAALLRQGRGYFLDEGTDA